MRRPDPPGRLPPADRRLAALGTLLALVPLVLAATIVPAAPAHGGPTLRAGLRRRERFGPGEVRRYPVALRAGDFLHVVATEEGIDVVLRLLDPDGREVVHVDGPTRPKEDEELAAVAPREGAFRLEIAADPKHSVGHLALRVVDLRPAGERDRRLAEAIRLTQQADEEMFQKYPAGWRRQLATRERALALWRQLGDGRRQAVELLQSGEVRYNLEEIEAASRLLHQAIDGFRAAGDRGGLVEALYAAGRTDRRRWRSNEAIVHFGEALPLARAASDSWMEANLLDALGNAHADLGLSREGLVSIARARELAHAGGHRDIEARILINLGSAYADLGERQKALGLYHEALDIAYQTALPDLQAPALHDLAETHLFLGKLDDALAEYRQALALFRQLGIRRDEAWSLDSVAQIEMIQGHCADAARDFAGAAAIGHQIADRASEADARARLAIAEICLDQTARGLAEAQTAVRLAPPGNDAEVEAWFALGDAHRAGHDMPAAAVAFGRARDISRARHNRANEAVIALLLARTARDMGQLDRAARLAGESVDLVESMREPVVAEGLRATFLAQTQDYFDVAIESLMALARARPRDGYAERALAMAERGRARSLLDLLAAAGTAPRPRVAPQLARHEQEARAEVTAAETRRRDLLRGGAPAAEVAAADRRIETALTRYDRVDAEIADRSPRDASLAHPRPLTAGEIQSQLLDPDTLLLEFALGERRSFLWVVAADGLASYELPARAALTTAARRYYGLETAPNQEQTGELPAARRARLAAAARELPRAAAELSRLLLSPAASRLGRRRLAIAADGVLQYVPFAALPDPTNAGEPLVASHEVVVLPSASTLAVQRRELAGRRPAPHLLAMLADPVFSRDDPRLAQRPGPPAPQPPPTRLLAGRTAPDLRGPEGVDCNGGESFPRLHFSSGEAGAITELVPAGERLVLTGFDASRDAALSGRLAGYRIVHFATHGCIDSRHPGLSSLVLSLVDRRGRPEDGFLRLADVSDMELHADLVVLSACRTALGREMPGEGLIGLTRGFMHAGAARVLASLWSVDDRATAELMKRFYRGLLVERRTPAAALRAAQLGMARQSHWASPYYWAGFSLEGDWR